MIGRVVEKANFFSSRHSTEQKRKVTKLHTLNFFLPCEKREKQKQKRKQVFLTLLTSLKEKVKGATMGPCFVVSCHEKTVKVV